MEYLMRLWRAQSMPRASAGRGRGLELAALVVIVLVALPWYASFATQRLLVEVLTVFTMALAWNLLAGYGGLVTVGQHAFVGVGAYALFAASNHLQMNPWLLLPVALVSSALFAAASAWPMFRLSGPHFAVGTWVLAEVMRIAVLNAEWLGAGGGLPLAMMGEYDRFVRNAGVYWAALAVGVCSFAIARSMLKGRLGLALMSLRDAEGAAQACGVPVQRAKLTLWVIAGCMTGCAGAVAYMNTLQVTPDASFGLSWTAVALFIAVLGGIGTLEGPILGTLIYFALREGFADYGAWYFIGLGLLAIVTMVLAPGGAWSLVSRQRAIDPFRVRRRMPSPRAPASATDGEPTSNQKLYEGQR
jgi:branched-chain amino acid transport system permease protein